MPDADLGSIRTVLDAQESLRRYLASLAAGIGDPRLPLLTEGSRIFRVIVPRNEEQQLRISEYLQQRRRRSAAVRRQPRACGARSRGSPTCPSCCAEDPTIFGMWTRQRHGRTFTASRTTSISLSNMPTTRFSPALRAQHVTGMDSTIYGSHVATPAARLPVRARARSASRRSENFSPRPAPRPTMPNSPTCTCSRWIGKHARSNSTKKRPRWRRRSWRIAGGWSICT